MSELSENQKQEVDYDYLGRFMYGATCPAVVVCDIGRFGTKARTRHDNMGMDYVVYAPE